MTVANKTTIAWCDSTVNPTSGCDGCELWVPGRGGACYAGHIHNRFSPSPSYPGEFEKLTLHRGRMIKSASLSDLRGTDRSDKPWLNGMPRMIFVGDMSDNFSDDVQFGYLADEVVSNIISAEGSRHVWIWLTKRPMRMAKFADYLHHEVGCRWPANLWAMTSVTSSNTVGRVDHLCDVPAAIRGVSVEPIWDAVDLSSWHEHLSWVIIGGQSGRNPNATDINDIRKTAAPIAAAKIALFIKQLGSKPVGTWRSDPTPFGTPRRWLLKDTKGEDWNEFPPDLQVREVPQPC